MPTQKVQKKKKSPGSGGFVFGTLSFLIICAAIVIAICVFFRVSKFEISGAEQYSEDQIIEASGIKKGKSLMTISCSAAQEKLETLDYVGRAEVSRKMPDTVKITIHESDRVACVSTDKGYWLLDSYGRLIESANGQSTDKFISINGVTANAPVKGKKMSVSEEDESKAEYLVDILQALEGADMLSNVSSIDVSNTANAQFEYLGRFTVKLGRDENTGSKLALLKSAIEKLNENDKGSFDLSENKKASFSPN